MTSLNLQHLSELPVSVKFALLGAGKSFAISAGVSCCFLHGLPFAVTAGVTSAVGSLVIFGIKMMFADDQKFENCIT